ncbi:MAG TPA: hypothetical protein DC060_21550 [Gemmatimonadetes bacterium]|nr:hypothetical protein [Gemmatimonadota bacterium]HAC06515.1 hypothetical protein [Gemmatimonadota bacterium]HBE00764.1 hypothetical protein [Gemmatimonadota bacterium]HIN51675.1 hypothetical protein [Gemmatimonadota bacterium]
MGFFELLLGVSVAGAAFAAVFARRKGSSWWNVLGLIAPLLGLAGFASAFAFLGEVNAIWVGAAFILPTLWLSFRRSRTMFTVKRAPVALPGAADLDDPAEALLREADLAAAAEVQRALRGRVMRRVLGPAIVLGGAGVLLGNWTLALMGGVTLVACALVHRFVLGPGGQQEALPRAREFRLRPPVLSHGSTASSLDQSEDHDPARLH